MHQQVNNREEINALNYWQKMIRSTWSYKVNSSSAWHKHSLTTKHRRHCCWTQAAMLKYELITQHYTSIRKRWRPVHICGTTVTVTSRGGGASRAREERSSVALSHIEASFLSNRMILVPVLLLCVFTGNSHLQRICYICCSDSDHNNLNTFSPCRCELWGAQSSPQWAQSALCGRQHRVSVLQLPQTRNYRLFLLVSATSRKTTSVSHLTLSIRICAK